MLGSRQNGKKLMTAAGTRFWCFVTHKGVSRPSGKVGELGVNGEIGECRTNDGAVCISFCCSPVGLVGGDSGGGSAFRGGSLYDCVCVSNSSFRLQVEHSIPSRHLGCTEQLQKATLNASPSLCPTAGWTS